MTHQKKRTATTHQPPGPMLIDLPRFVAAEQSSWDELSAALDALERDSSLHGNAALDLPRAERLHYLYQRAASDLARLATFSAESDLHRSLGALVARAYAEIHARSGPAASRAGGPPGNPWRWFTGTFPRAFRRHARAFWLALAITVVGCAFGALALAIDPEARAVTLPFGHADMDPAQRVADEEHDQGQGLSGHMATMSGWLMQNNIKVSVLALALGCTWGIGTMIVMFSNGVYLGAIIVDYLRAGQGVFLAGWLLPHGSVEIPAILVAGQAGLVLGGALVGWGRRVPLRERLRAIRADLVTLIAGVALMLVWAGLIEAFFSQYHAPVLPYSVKISFGAVELVALTLFFALAGRNARSRL